MFRTRKVGRPVLGDFDLHSPFFVDIQTKIGSMEFPYKLPPALSQEAAGQQFTVIRHYDIKDPSSRLTASKLSREGREVLLWPDGVTAFSRTNPNLMSATEIAVTYERKRRGLEIDHAEGATRMRRIYTQLFE